MGTSLSESQQRLGATRSLTEVFILLRNNAIQSRRIFSTPTSIGKGADSHHDKMSLIPLNEPDSDEEEENLDPDLEAGRIGGRLPPDWVAIVDEIQYEVSRVKSRISELDRMQQAHLTRPSFNDQDTGKEEEAIEDATAEVTKMLSHCQKLIQMIQSEGSGKVKERTLAKNVLSAQLALLQQVTQNFRQSQTAYLRQIQQREESLKGYFDAFSPESPGSMFRERPGGSLITMGDEVQGQASSSATGEMSMAQLQALEENSEKLKEREREVLHITKSIVEVNQLFKDLAAFVVDQGTVLDRIDFNIEQSNLKVQAASRSVRKADQYQRKNRKMVCILCLTVSIIVLMILLVIVKS